MLEASVALVAYLGVASECLHDITGKRLMPGIMHVPIKEQYPFNKTNNSRSITVTT